MTFRLGKGVRYVKLIDGQPVDMLAIVVARSFERAPHYDLRIVIGGKAEIVANVEGGALRPAIRRNVEAVA